MLWSLLTPNPSVLYRSIFFLRAISDYAIIYCKNGLNLTVIQEKGLHLWWWKGYMILIWDLLQAPHWPWYSSPVWLHPICVSFWPHQSKCHRRGQPSLTLGAAAVSALERLRAWQDCACFLSLTHADESPWQLKVASRMYRFLGFCRWKSCCPRHKPLDWWLLTCHEPLVEKGHLIPWAL